MLGFWMMPLGHMLPALNIALLRQLTARTLRMSVELGSRALKGLGWQWRRSRRADSARVARHWLVLAVVSL